MPRSKKKYYRKLPHFQAFYTPKHPGMRAFNKRLIGVVKICLKKVLLRRQVTVIELGTLLIEIEVRVNNRPLTYQTEEINEPEALTQAHLIYGGKLQILPIYSKDDSEYTSGPLQHQLLELKNIDFEQDFGKIAENVERSI